MDLGNRSRAHLSLDERPRRRHKHAEDHYLSDIGPSRCNACSSASRNTSANYSTTGRRSGTDAQTKSPGSITTITDVDREISGESSTTTAAAAAGEQRPSKDRIVEDAGE